MGGGCEVADCWRDRWAEWDGQQDRELASNLGHAREQEALPNCHFKLAAVWSGASPCCTADQDRHESSGGGPQATPCVHQEGVEGPARPPGPFLVLGEFFFFLLLAPGREAGRIPEWLMGGDWAPDGEVNGCWPVRVPTWTEEVSGPSAVTIAHFPLAIRKGGRLQQSQRGRRGYPSTPLRPRARS